MKYIVMWVAVLIPNYLLGQVYDQTLARQHFWTVMTQSPQTAASANMLSTHAVAASQQKVQLAVRSHMQQVLRRFQHYVRNSDELLFRKLNECTEPNWVAINKHFGSVEIPKLVSEDAEFDIESGGRRVQVLRVIDGDTFEATDGTTVRLLGIDTPETIGGFGKEQNFGEEATRQLKQLIGDKWVTIFQVGIAHRGRDVAWVTDTAGESVNTEMVARGLAWWDYRYAPEADTLKAAQKVAASLGRGLHRDPSAMPPWEFRKKFSTNAR